jgi:hypothetical protein
MTPDEILAELVTLSRQLEEYHAAAWLIERRRDELQGQLRATGWVAPTISGPRRREGD